MVNKVNTPAKAPQADANSSTIGRFTIEDGISPPKRGGGGGAIGGQVSEYREPLLGLDAGKSFFDVVPVSDSITDAAEIAKARTEEYRKFASRITSVVRNLKKSHPGLNVSMAKTLRHPDKPEGVDNEFGIRVWRNEDKAPAEPAPAPAGASELPPPPVG